MADGTMVSARAIAEELLDITGDALLSGDFDAFAAVFHLPNTMTTLSGVIFIKDEAHLRRVFDGVRSRLQTGGVTHLVRFIEAAEFRSPTQIAATHVTHMMAGTTRLEEPYPVFSINELVDGVWKSMSSEYAVRPRSPQENAILASALRAAERGAADAKD